MITYEVKAVDDNVMLVVSAKDPTFVEVAILLMIGQTVDQILSKAKPAHPPNIVAKIEDCYRSIYAKETP